MGDQTIEDVTFAEPPQCPEGYEPVLRAGAPVMQFNSFPTLRAELDVELGQIFGSYDF